MNVFLNTDIYRIYTWREKISVWDVIGLGDCVRFDSENPETFWLLSGYAPNSDPHEEGFHTNAPNAQSFFHYLSQSVKGMEGRYLALIGFSDWPPNIRLVATRA